MITVFAEAEAPRSAHPHLKTQISWSSPDPSCSLQLVSALPVDVIVDSFQLQQLHTEARLVNASTRAGALRIRGHRDLEAPAYLLENRDTIVVLELPRTEHISVDVPVHLRYQAPRAAALVIELDVQPPLIVQTCRKKKGQRPDLGILPLEALDMLIDSKDIVSVTRAGQSIKLFAPAGSAADLFWVEPVNIAIIWLGAFILLFSAWRSR